MRADLVGDRVEPRHAGLRVERDGRVQAVPKMLRQMRLIQRAGFLDQPIEVFQVERADPAVLAEHRVGHEEVRVQVGIARHRHGKRLGDLVAVLLHRHRQRRAGGMVVEGDPGGVPRVPAGLPALALGGPRDVMLEVDDGLVRRVAMRLPDGGLLGRRGERPGHADRLVRRQGEVHRAERDALLLHAGLGVGVLAEGRIVFAGDLLAVGPPPGEERADFFPREGPLRIDPQAFRR